MPTVSRGALFRHRGSRNWFIKFYLDRRPRRETTGTPDRDEAEAFLARRIDEAKRGFFHDVSERITCAQMKDLLLRNYAFKGNRTDPGRHLNNLAVSFRALRGEEITEDRIAEYSRKRLEDDGAAPGDAAPGAVRAAAHVAARVAASAPGPPHRHATCQQRARVSSMRRTSRRSCRTCRRTPASWSGSST